MAIASVNGGQFGGRTGFSWAVYTRRSKRMVCDRGAAVDVRDAAEQIAADEAKLQLAGDLMWTAGARSDVRFEKVAALQEAIAAGTYNVSAADLAEKLMLGMRS